MDTQTVLAISLLNLKVSALFQQYPASYKIFARHGLACLGCYLTAFCSLQDAIHAYDLDPVAISREIQAAVRKGGPFRAQN